MKPLPGRGGEGVIPPDMKYFDSIRLDLPYEQAVTRVREVLAEQGFGVLTEIDVRATMKAKLGEDMED